MTRARFHQDRALALNPNYDLVVVQMGELFTWLGEAREGVEWIEKAMKLNPHHPARFWSHLGKAQFVAHQYAKAIESFLRMASLDIQQHAFLAASYGWLGDATAASAHVARLRELDPTLEPDKFLGTQHFVRNEDRQHLREGLQKAGF
jgi:adenylate cyclase